jgi:hypothetical protein
MTKRPFNRTLWIPLASLSLGLTVLCGCQSIPAYRQRLVAKPSMQFSQSPVFNYDAGLLPQIESGAAASGGGQAAGCTSCR